MAYTNSSDIRIFPSSDRDATITSQYGTNFITEYNLSSIVNKLICGGTTIDENNANHKPQIPGTDTSLTTNSLHGFIISPSYNATKVITVNTTDMLEFNLHGYFISVSVQSILEGRNTEFTFGEDSKPTAGEQNFVQFVEVSSDTGNRIYAVIACRDKGLDDKSYAKLLGTDTGVDITFNSETDSVYWLALLTGSGSSWTVCKDSYIQFQNMSRIDDGEL